MKAAEAIGRTAQVKRRELAALAMGNHRVTGGEVGIFGLYFLCHLPLFVFLKNKVHLRKKLVVPEGSETQS